MIIAYPSLRYGKMKGLGLTPSASRRVKPIPAALLALVPKPTDKNTTVLSTEPDVVSETMPTIMSKVKRTLYQTKKLAAAIEGTTLADTLRNDSNFVLDYIKYQLDDSAHEEIRSPRRTVHDAKGDCDCMATLLASLLMNQKIAFNLRIAKYKNGSDWSHIYIVVPKDQSSKKALTNRADYYVLDPVTNKHDYEAPTSEIKDFTMGLKYLDGIGAGNLGCNCGCGSGTKSTCDNIPTIKKLRHFVSSQQIVADGKVPTECFLRDNKIPFTQGVDNEKHQGYFIVKSEKGQALRLTPVITHAEAATLKQVCVRSAPPVPTREERLLAMYAATASVRMVDGNMGVLPKSENYILATPLSNDNKNILVAEAEGANTQLSSMVKIPTEQSGVATANTAHTTVAPATKEGYNWFGLLGSAAIALMTMPAKGGAAVSGLGGIPKVARKKKRVTVVATMKM